MRYPIFRQYDSKDCGPACLRMISEYYGKSFSLEYLKKLCESKKTGTSLLGISDAAETIGFKTIGVKLTIKQLCASNLPCIISWNQNHFVVVYRIKNNKVWVGDPAAGCVLKYSLDSFSKSWCSIIDSLRGDMGIALLMEPSADFNENREIDTKTSKPKMGFAYLFRFLKPHRLSILKICLGILIGSLISMVFPLLTQSIVDIGIRDGNIGFITTILIAQFVLTIGQAFNSLIKNWLMLHVTIKVNLSLVSNFLGKLMKLPIAFFDSKRLGDTLQRIRDFGRIQNFLTGELIGISMGLIGLLVYSIMMAGYNGTVLVVFLIGSLCYVSWILLFMKKRRKLDYMRFQESARNESNVVQIINSMQEIKLNNCERQQLWEWEKTQNKLYNVSIKGLSLSQIQSVGGIFIDQIKNLFISYLTASLVISGDLTIGMMMSIQYIMGQLNAPVYDFVSFIRSFQDTKISLERLDEVQKMDDEETINMDKVSTIPQDADIILENVTFQYNGKRSKKVLNNINLKIPANKTTAIVGASGSGKTTLLKIILGFYEPTEGGVFLNHIPLREYDVREWRRSCGVVMQEGYIFSNTIRENIGIGGRQTEMSQVKTAARISNIDSFIESLPLGYNTFVGPDGIGLSSGQKQRLLIARAAYKNTKYIFFDEATNALDAENEQIIIKNLNGFLKEKTAMIIAHRLSTVKNADNIVVLDDGKIVETGTHYELVSKRGYYYNLVKNQIDLGE